MGSRAVRVPGLLFWDVRNDVGRILTDCLYGAGWALTLSATFPISHFDFFGLRHPLALGFVIAFWAAPTMTAGHLLFSGIMTLYLAAGTMLEERDLVQWFGDTYRDYRCRVPAIVPFFRRRR